MRTRFGVRLRSALAAAGVVAVASILAGVALVIAARILLAQAVDQSATQRALQVAAAAGDQGADLDTLTNPAPPDRIVVQILDAQGKVIAGSPSVPMAPLRPRPGQVAHAERKLGPGNEDRFQVVATGVDGTNGASTVLVAQSLEEVNDATEAMLAALAVGMPLLTVVVGGATFVFVGRTLRPVEAMRRQADTITARSLDTRLPVPPARDEIAALAATMNTMLDRIEAATATQHRFVADASHELRSPLATIHIGLELLTAADLPDEVRAHVRRMFGESVRMGRLIDDLLLLARVDESGLHLRHEDVDLDDLVYAERERLAAERPELRVEARVSPARVSGDAHHLRRALRNVVDNAARHARATVRVDLRTEGDHVDLLVADDGLGIPAAQREVVFDRFVRLDDDRSRRCGGTGLGLPITRDIVAAHGGTVVIEEAVGGGAAVRIRLPLP